LEPDDAPSSLRAKSSYPSPLTMTRFAVASRAASRGFELKRCGSAPGSLRIDDTLAWRPPICATTSPQTFSAATTCTTRAPFVGSAGEAPQPAAASATITPKHKPETVFITGS
jgi:hypothetical protein